MCLCVRQVQESASALLQKTMDALLQRKDPLPDPPLEEEEDPLMAQLVAITDILHARQVCEQTNPDNKHAQKA